MKLGQKIHPNNILDEFENDAVGRIMMFASASHKSAASREMMRQKRLSEKGGGDGVLENSGKPIIEGLKSPTDSQDSDDRLLYSDVGMIHPIVTSEASMKTTCAVNAAEIATNCTSEMMIGTESALKNTPNTLEEDTDKYYKLYQNLQTEINDQKDGNDMTYEEFFKTVVQMPEAEYIKIIR
ncbi:hypothetical protein DPMN_108214, partial [Dreissena polymorpha]